MRPAPRPTWSGCAGGHRVVNGWSARFRRVIGRQPHSWQRCGPPR
jgi:hypothetical protein